ncbi:MAG: M1 family metallopeptidase, partial [Chitinophagales bacterium]
MLKKYCILFIGFNLHLIAFAQTASYWQQDVDYEIHVALDDVQHMLHGNVQINYTNNSPDTLYKIWMHVWPNAYKDTKTALAEQLYASKSDVMLKAGKADLGYMDSLAFTVDGQAVHWQLDAMHPDIGSVDLNFPLLPGKSIKIESPFRVKIPVSAFSRLGHSEQSYQITQWYPKPAVYDRKGWHAMPYLNQGEFYSEFGNFNVYITLPDNYIVGASGDLQTASEIAFLNQKALQTSSINNFDDDLTFPPSASTKKTLHYRLENAHDFAWFADKRFHVLKGQVTLPFSQRTVTTWSYFTNFEAALWKKSIEYINQSVLSYSDWVGEYPYNVAQAVEGALSAGGGMEYPTITIIGKSGNERGLDNVIAHEVGHNWFYGILASNERQHAWMDEGINSFYEDRYIAKYYGENIDPSVLGIGDFTDNIGFLNNKSLVEV